MKTIDEGPNCGYFSGAMQTEVNVNQLNDVVRSTLQTHLAGLYRLTPQGQEMVFAANGALAEDYAHGHNLPIANWCYQDIWQKLSLLPPRSFDLMLDVCAGTGYVSLNVMKHKGFKRCIAIDINPAALKILKDQADALGIPNVEVQRENIMHTSFAPESMDCVMGNSFLHHLPDNEAFLKESFRILKPGGVLCLTHEPTLTATKWENLIGRVLRRALGKPEFAQIVLTDLWQYDHKAIEQLLKSVGFREVRLQSRGRIAIAVGTFACRVVGRLTGNIATNWVFRLQHWMVRFESLFQSKAQSDDRASLTILARK